MAEESFEKWKDFQLSRAHGFELLTLDRVILHTVVHHSSTSTYMPNLTEIKEAFCGRMAGRTDIRDPLY